MDSQTQYRQLILPDLESVIPSPKSFPGGAGPGRGKRKNTNAAVVDRWQGGAQGFYNWLSDISPCILTRSNRYEVYSPTPKQQAVIGEILTVDENNNFVNSMSLLIWPRRHGKSTIFALIVLWLITSRPNLTIQLLGNTEDHSRRVQYRTLKRIIQNTLKLSALIPDDKILSLEIAGPFDSVIQMQTGVNVSTAFGDKINLLWVSDLHASADLSAFNALQASLLDSEDSLVLIDSNIGTHDDHISGLMQEAKADESIFCDHIEYRDLKHYNKEAPQWLDRNKAKRLERTVLEADFKRDILGKSSSKINSLLPQDVLDLCRDSYRCPVEDIKALVGDRSYLIAGGLDRADSEWGSVFGNDNSVFTTICKVADPENQESLIYILDQHVFRPSTGRTIKKHILAMHKKYDFKNVTLEAHNVTDIQPFLIEQGIPCETVSPHSTTQNIAWPELVRIAKTGRLRISKDLPKLFSEMAGMTYTKLGTGNYKFSHGSRSQKDDRPFSLLWSVYSLRNEILQLYTLGNVQCLNKSSRRQNCYIFGGGLELLCGENCLAAQEVKEMYRQFLQYQTESELTLPDFYHAYVSIKGAVLYQAA